MTVKIITGCLLILISSVYSSILRCDLIDPHSRESELCWKQMSLRLKLYPQATQESNTESAVHTRNAELSSALMQLYGFDKFNGKRNPEFSRDVMKYISDAKPYRENY